MRKNGSRKKKIFLMILSSVIALIIAGDMDVISNNIQREFQ